MFSTLQRVNLCDMLDLFVYVSVILYVCVYGEMWYMQMITGALEDQKHQMPWS